MPPGQRAMMTQGPGGDGPGPRDGEERRRGDRIAVGAGDDTVVRMQLAARWAEEFAPEGDDNLPARLRRFRSIYEYLDAVMHGVEPPDVEPPAAPPVQPAPPHEPAPAPAAYASPVPPAPPYAPPPPPASA